MKLLRMMLILWKYRDYDTVYFIRDTSWGGTIDVTIKLAKIMSYEGQFITIKLLNGDIRKVHRSWTADTYKEAKQIKQGVIQWERGEWYD